ncbi:MAG: RtcB family protein, partial [Candidatus Hydrothermarchaeales archaeon]
MRLTRLNEYSYKIEREEGMRVPAIIFASDKLMEKIRVDKTLEQTKNVAYLKGIQKHALTMPDAHQGYGFPIGGVAAFDMEEGIVSPG